MPNTKCWDGLKKLLNNDLEGKRRKITFISGSIGDKSKSKSYRNGASKNLAELGIDIKDFTLLYKNYKEVNQKGEVNYSSDDMAEQIYESDIVYLLGGDPHDQTSYLKDNNLDIVLSSFKGIIIGASSGSMTMSKNVIVPPCGDKYPTQDIRDGIGLTELSIFPHLDYHLNQESITTKDGLITLSDLLKISKQIDILGLTNESIIRYSNNEIYLMGETPFLLSNGEINETNLVKEKIDNTNVKKLVLAKK